MGLILNTLGRLEILWEGRPASQLTLRKSQALLIYLALQPGDHDRGRLAGLLWAEMPESNARRNLRHALHDLRSSLAPHALASDRLTATLHPDLPAHIDALAFSSRVADAERHLRAGDKTAAIRHLAQAMGLYRGDFLASFDLPNCVSFEEWATRLRARYRQQALDALDHLVTYWTRRGTYDRALEYARRQIALEPLRERAHRQMMHLLALSGERSAALAQYEACQRTLAKELGVEPLRETTELFEAIRASALAHPEAEEDVSEREGSIRPLDPLTALPFVGREEEHARLIDLWERARRGTGGRPGTPGPCTLTLVEGEAGIGKTRLVEEALRYAETQGALVLRGRCYEFGSSLPYQPIAAALRGAVSHLSNEDGGAPAPASVWVTELVRLLPELRQAYPELPLSQPGGEAARQRLFEAVVRFLRTSSCNARALPLFLDDLHWADGASLDLLHYLVRHLDGTPIWLVGTYRPEELAPDHPLVRLRQGLGRDHRVERLVLEQLSSASVQAISHTLVGEITAADLGDYLYRESEGTPLILAETVSDLLERGALTKDPSAEPAGAGSASSSWDRGSMLTWRGPPEGTILPDSVQDVILQRTGRLGRPAQRLLDVAAVIGQPFDEALLRLAAGDDAREVSHSLNEWRGRHLMQTTIRVSGAESGTETGYDFSHDKIRTVVYHAMAPDHRRALHARVARALEQRFPARRSEHAASLAYHWERAGAPERALPHLIEAGDQARAVYASREAIDYYQRALAMAQALGAGGHEQAAHVLMKLGLAHHTRFDFAAGREAHLQALAIWSQLHGGTTEDRGLRRPSPAPHPLRLRWLEPTTLDPALSPDSHTSGLLAQLFSGLVTLSRDGGIAPDVAHAWDVSVDGRRYVFHLRDDARWSDGVPVTAGDFVTAWRRTLAPATRAPGADYLLVIKGARAFHAQAGGSGSTTANLGVRAIDDQTLEVELEEPTGHFLQVLVRPETYPAPRHALATHGDAWAAPEHVITNGPFRLAEWQPGERVTLARNRGHYGEAHTQGNVEQVELLPLTSASERLAAYDAGALDILGVSFFPPEERARARRTHPGEAIARPILETCYLVFDVTRPPFDDARVRRALALATDREALVDEALEGDAVAAMGGLLPQGMPGHSPDIGPPHDPEAAQRLLAEAGYPDGAGFPAVRALGFAAIAPRAAFLQTQWRQILSIDVAWETPDWTSFLEGMGKGTYRLTAYLWVADYPDPDAFLHLSRAATWANWHNETFEGLVESARRTLDQEERVELYRRAERLLVAEAPILPLTYEMEHLLIKPWVNRYPTAPSRAVFWQDVVIEDH